jgi:hypothetical protein
MFRLEWFGLAVLTAVTIAAAVPSDPIASDPIASGPVPSEASTSPAIGVVGCPSHYSSRAETLANADTQYRRGDAGYAATIIRWLPSPLDPELASLAELYTAFAEASATIASPTTTTIDLFVALRRAQALDMALGGAFADRLNDLMRTVAPEAAAEYTRMHDRTGADLAKHTAELFK